MMTIFFIIIWIIMVIISYVAYRIGVKHGIENAHEDGFCIHFNEVRAIGYKEGLEENINTCRWCEEIKNKE